MIVNAANEPVTHLNRDFYAILDTFHFQLSHGIISILFISTSISCESKKENEREREREKEEKEK